MFESITTIFKNYHAYHIFFTHFFTCRSHSEAQAEALTMSAPGTVIFNAKDGFDEDIWDDSALIRQYDRALQSSR